MAKKSVTVALVHVDAHADVKDEMFGERETKRTRRVYEEGLIVANKVHQVGLRGTGYTADDFAEAASWGFHQYLAPNLWHKSLLHKKNLISNRAYSNIHYLRH